MGISGRAKTKIWLKLGFTALEGNLLFSGVFLFSACFDFMLSFSLRFVSLRIRFLL